MRNLKVYLESLGCDKNTVDSEYILGNLVNAGFEITHEVESADLVIVNTCCFIEEAKRESIESIFNLLEEKKDDGKLIVSGCMAVRYEDELTEEIPEIDGFIHFNDIENILKLFELDSTQESKRLIPDLPYAFLKISEGCNKNCTYCAIPGIKGRHVSRPIEDILTEAKLIEEKGIKELIIVAQDLTQYGSDLEGKEDLTELLRRLSEEFDFKWIRLLYLYPEGINDELLDLISEKDNILPYFDIPIQHTSDNILRKMGRKINKKKIIDIVHNIREKLPESILRSTVIVGFPGETQEDFEELLKDLSELQFDRLGAFSYSREEGTPAYDFKDQIADEIKQDRIDQVNKLQNEIMTNRNLLLLNKKFPAIIEEKIDERTYSARLYSDAPDIDCILYLDSQDPLQIGEIMDVKVNRVLGYDLLGEIDESAQ